MTRFAEQRTAEAIAQGLRAPPIPEVKSIEEAQEVVRGFTREQFLAFVREAYPGPANLYPRLKILFNAGFRGADLC
jgi:hypothetical protein